MASTTKFDEILNKIDFMSIEEQEILLEILKNRYKERRRELILANAKKTLEEYKAGLTSEGSAEDLIKELESD